MSIVPVFPPYVLLVIIHNKPKRILFSLLNTINFWCHTVLMVCQRSSRFILDCISSKTLSMEEPSLLGDASDVLLLFPFKCNENHFRQRTQNKERRGDKAETTWLPEIEWIPQVLATELLVVYGFHLNFSELVVVFPKLFEGNSSFKKTRGNKRLITHNM